MLVCVLLVESCALSEGCSLSVCVCLDEMCLGEKYSVMFNRTIYMGPRFIVIITVTRSRHTCVYWGKPNNWRRGNRRQQETYAAYKVKKVQELPPSK